jgi:hypothetical protein
VYGVLNFSREIRMKALIADKVDNDTMDTLVAAHLDVTGAANVEVLWNESETILWVNVNGVCLLRICQIKEFSTNHN